MQEAQTDDFWTYDENGNRHRIRKFTEYQDVPQQGGGFERIWKLSRYQTFEGKTVTPVKGCEDAFDIIHPGVTNRTLRVTRK